MQHDIYSPHIEISLDNLLHNANELRKSLSRHQRMIAVVKDSAYGCGSIEIARTLEIYGEVHFFAVACTSEAFALRQAGIKGQILVLGRASDDPIRWGASNDIVFALNDLDDLHRWQELGTTVRFHCFFDTGMNRMGLLPGDIEQAASIITKCDTLKCEGAFTHFANADEPHTMVVDTQLRLFRSNLDRLRLSGVNPKEIHYNNSAACMRFPIHEECTLIRPGIALYGCRPDPLQEFELDLRPIISLKSHIVKMKQVPPGTTVSYCGNYRTKEETSIATIAIGYAHGFPRLLSNKGQVLINGCRYTIAGNVTMDYIMVDAGKEPSMKVGDEVVVMGYQGKESISPDEIARAIGTIGYEIMCNLSTAIDRRYLLNGSTVIQKGKVF